ncbi:hypothetical protein IQ219_02540 [Synechocystis sp. LEGE 06083]|uniref:tape measure protein n=1 Tax=Synechocystis sp. LEGE 06083 TaxID=915336 RepID=UPI0018806C59|nr:tape measure protein [Synechocystis sp. LEGE 06083]MBE9194226.1 hypothetical protein [Synechocystis sp. LEGE 06083]
MTTLFTVGIEVQASAAQQAITRTEKAFKRLADGSQSAQVATDKLNKEFQTAANGLKYYTDAQGRWRAENGRFVSQAEKAAAGIGGLTKEVDKSSRAIEQASAGLTVMRVALGNVASAAIVGGVRALTNQFQQLSSSVISTGARAEKTAVAFETFLGSAEKAKKVMKDVRDFAATTPFELPEVTEAAKQLLATRTPAEELIGTISRLGEIAAGADKPLSQLLFVYTQIKNQGRATGEDINQLLNAGLSMDDIARALGKSAKELGQMKGSSKGLQLSFEEVQKVLIAVTSEGGRFSGLMDKLGSTTAVKLSNVNDAFTKIYQSIYDGISPAISGVLDVVVGILDPLGENKSLWADVNAQAESFKSYLEDNPAVIKAASDGLEDGIKVGLKAATDLSKGLLGYLEKNPDAIAKAVEKVDLLVKGLGEAYKIIALSVEGWEKLIGAGRITPTNGAERIIAAGGTNADAQGFQDEVNRRIGALPWWNAFNNAGKEEIVREVFEEVLAKVEQRQAKIQQAAQTTAPPPQPEAQKQTQQAITTELEKQAQALVSQLPKQRALADLEIQRLQQRLDLERAYGQISQQEVLRREAAIRLRRNELALASLSLEKAEQEQRIKNGESVNRQDFSAQETAIREENAFIQQKLQADIARLERERQDKLAQIQLKSEQDLFNVRLNNEMALHRLQVEHAQILMAGFGRNASPAERKVLDVVGQVYEQEAAIRQAEMEYRRERAGVEQELAMAITERNQLAQASAYQQINLPNGNIRNVIDDPVVWAQITAMDANINRLEAQLSALDQPAIARANNESARMGNAVAAFQNLFPDEFANILRDTREQIDRRLGDIAIGATPMAQRPPMLADQAIAQIYDVPRSQLLQGLQKAVEAGNSYLTTAISTQISILDKLKESGKIQELWETIKDLEELNILEGAVNEHTRFIQNLTTIAQVERDRTGEMADQLKLMQLQGDEAIAFNAQMRAKAVFAERFRQLEVDINQAQGTPLLATLQTQWDEMLAQQEELTNELYRQGQAQEIIVRQQDVFQEKLNQTRAIAEGLGDSFANAFGEFVTGTKSAQEAFAGMMGSMANVFLQEFQRMTAQKAAAGLMGLIGNAFGLPQLSAAIASPGVPQAALSGIGAFDFGGGAGSSGFSAANVAGFGQPLGMPLFNAFAEGGIVTKPMMGLVGEAGREAIIPLDRLDSMGTVNNVNISISMDGEGNASVNRDNSSQLGKELESAVVAVLQKQRRPGGVLFRNS